ncbi:MAG TPA: polyprenyl synthetase family protein [bacterium]|nr:polyprenyl synthetase family protein [bacterium]
MRAELILKKYGKIVDAALDRFLGKPRFPSVLHKSMRYSLFAGGKRLRPILAILTAQACSAPYSRVLPAACGLEMIHTYSLIHDDLPAMDNDDMRRGIPTCHVKFGEAAAILAGDALLTKAFELIALNGRVKGVTPAAAVNAAAEIGAAAGADGMVGGQVVDMLFEGRRVTPKELSFIHSHKTGALITASITAAAMLAGAGEAKIRHFRGFGEKIGLAFQIADDILDITGDEKKLGKTKGKDLKAGKATYPGLFGIEKSREKAENLVLEALRISGKIGNNKGVRALSELARFFVSRTY